MKVKRSLHYLLLGIVAVGVIMMSSCISKKKLAARADKERHDYMVATYTQIKDSFQEAEVSILNDSVKVTFPENIVFTLNSSTIQPNFNTELIRFSNLLNRYNQTNVLINGYTDATGTDAYNIKLSTDRAKSTRDALVANKVDKGRLYTWGLGSQNPIADNSTDAGRAKNRRIEFVILYNVPSKQ